MGSSTSGRYDLLRRLASGGMADVYLAREGGSDRLVAVKVLHAERADAEAATLFEDEARLVGMLNHPNLAAVYEAAVVDGAQYLAMEYVDGADLRELMTRADAHGGALELDAAMSIVAAAAAGLDHAHRRCSPEGRPLHLVHRDVSLSNIMVAHDGAVKVIDFGIATSTASLHTTNPGIVRGKPSYMSPEQCRGDAVDRRTDVFALGVVLYELTTGRRCFNGASDFHRMLAVVRGEYTPPSRLVPGYPAALEAVIAKALAPAPQDRFASAAALVEALGQVARAFGWTLGTATTARVMRTLFAETPVATLDVDDDAPTRARRSLPRVRYAAA